MADSPKAYQFIFTLLLSLKINFYGASFSIFDFAIWYLFATLVIWIVKQLLF